MNNNSRVRTQVRWERFFWPGFVLLVVLHFLPENHIILGTWFYPLVWWSFIMMLEFWLARRDQSLFLQGKKSLLGVAFLSVILWLVFEAYNLYLGNWYYVGVPSSRFWRWSGTLISFATVLPGMWVVKRAVDQFPLDLFDGREPVSFSPWIHGTVLIAGLLFTTGPFIYPDVFFPFVWGGLLLFADWVAYRIGGRSFLRQIERGNYRRLLTWLIAGAICGILWEFWNSLATAGWIYTVPGMGEWRLFEMPILGYLGFPPFALMVWRLFTLWEDLKGQLFPAIKIILIVIAVGFSFFTLSAMDRYTYVSTVVDPSDFVGWADRERTMIMSNDVDSIIEATEVLVDPSSAKKIRFLRFAGLGTELGNCLWTRDIRSVSAIKHYSTKQLAEILRNCRGGPLRFWERRVKDWKQRA